MGLRSTGLKASEHGGSDARAGLGSYITNYNQERPHSSLGGRTPDMVYFNRPYSAAA